MKKRNPTREVRIGTMVIGHDRPLAVQSMTATQTQNVDATVAQIKSLEAAGADVVRMAVDGPKDAEALQSIREQTAANLCADLQENWRLAERVAPFVDKLRYNPGHLYHLEKDKTIGEKVAFIAAAARKSDCAIRVGVNCGSVDPDLIDRYGEDSIAPMVESALQHCAILDELQFERYCVSLKDSDPLKVIEANKRFAGRRPEIPLHLGVTEAGLPPEGVIKTRVAFEQLIAQGIGDTIRVSLTVPNDRKGEEIVEGRKILDDIEHGRFRSVPGDLGSGLNIISCPSCSRVENEAFVELAQKVKEVTRFASKYNLTIAVMGCRVNGPGETDDADLGLWCAPGFVNLKRGGASLGSYGYDEIIDQLLTELNILIESGAPQRG